MKHIILISLSLLLFGACNDISNDLKENLDNNDDDLVSSYTNEINNAVYDELSFENTRDFEDAERGLLARDSNLIVKSNEGTILWSQPSYEFVHGDAPSSVNPSLWRQAKLNNIHGLFKVRDSIYQLRGYDLANMTIIEGKTGWIIIDPLTAKETASKALEFARKHLGEKPIVAILFTHSHVDHFGGSLGIMSAEEAVKNKVRIIAPKGFMEEATSENIIVGTAMARRSMYMYGKNLPRSKYGHVGSGLGKSPTYGTFGIMVPNELIDHTLQEKNIDGVRFIFQYTPESEAPAEFTFYLPESKTFCGAEVVSNNMHNLYTLRGTKVRNAVNWSNYINEIIELFGDAEIYFGSHHWPKWGNENIIEFLKLQRDLYQYIHDQTVRLINAGYTSSEIPDRIKLPKSLSLPFANRGYYGTLRHNSRAVYQSYLGWYDGNPANLNPLAPEESSVKYVEMMGGSENILQKAQEYYEKGEYRWVAELLNHLVFAEPDNTRAKKILAKVYKQLGYQSESGPWRDVYLTAAQELINGAPKTGIDLAIMQDVLKETPTTYFFQSLAARLDGMAAEGKIIKVKIEFPDLKKTYILSLENSVLHHWEARIGEQVDASVKVTHALFIKMLVGKAGIKDILFSDELEIEGSKIDLIRFFTLFDKPDGTFNIIEP